MTSRLARRFPLLALAAVLCAGSARAQFVNGSFELGDFTGWETQDLDLPYDELAVVPTGTFPQFGAVEVVATDGLLAALTGFDGDGPGTIFLAQDVTVPAGRSTLRFDYKAGWDLELVPAQIDRTFSVVIEPAEGGEPLQTTLVRTAVANTSVPDTGLITANVDLSGFAGQTIRVKFEWDVPEDYSGPACCVLDNVRFVGKKAAAAELAKLNVKMNFVDFDLDTLAFDMVVPVSPDFDPDGEDVSITIGDITREFELDAAGNASDETDTLKLKAVGGDDTLRKVSLRCTQGDFAADLSDWGIDNTDTGPGGLYAAIPVMVDLDGEVTVRTLPVLFKATEDVKGSVNGKVSGDARAVKLLVRLDFGTPEQDLVTLKGFGVVAPGFEPEGTDATITLGSQTWDFTLDAQGKGSVEDATLAIKRDGKNPSLWAVSLKCSEADLAEALALDGLTEDTVLKPGIDVPLVLELVLDGRLTDVFLTANWVATEGFFGVAHAKF